MTALKVYVAGASAERTYRATPVMRALEAAGVTITEDWAEAMNATLMKDERLPPAERSRAALADLRGVSDADAVVFLVPGARSVGAWIEFGYAVACGKRIYAAGPPIHTVFGELVEHVGTDVDAVRRVIELGNP